MDDIDEIGKFGLSLDECEERDAYASVWKDMVAKDEKWGGRSQGGRGVRKVNGKPLSISLDQVNISFDGREILENASLKFNINHRYGLLGSNGVGKTTLLRRIVRGSIPGFPQYFNCHYVQQETSAFTDTTVYEFIMTTDGDDESKERRLAILKQEEVEYEEMLTNANSVIEIEEITTHLCEICEEIELLSLSSDDQSLSTSLDLDNATEKTLHEKLPPGMLQILKGLGLSSLKYLKRKLSSLSGGYRLRCYLAKALSNIKENSIVLLDECTNHLDILCIEWLEDYLVNHLPPAIVILVSHDHQFLENTCTDIIEMKNNKLEYFHGSYNDYLIHQEEMAVLQKHRLEKESSQERKFQEIIEKVRTNGQASQVRSKQKKLERVSMHRRLDGKKFKLFSLKQLAEEFLRFPDRIQAVRENRNIRFKFPHPDIGKLRLATPNSCILSIENANIGRQILSPLTSSPEFNAVLNNVTLQLNLKSKIAIIGGNGMGKTTLMEGITQALKGISLAPTVSISTCKGSGKLSVYRSESTPIKITTSTNTAATAATISTKSTTTATTNTAATTIHTAATTTIAGDYTQKAVIQGLVTVHPNLSAGIVTQNHITALSDFLLETAVSYIITQSKLKGGETWSELTARAHLGAFGLGDVALSKIGSLSGGQKARLNIATSCMDASQLLILDEPTNHLSLEAVEGLAVACREFKGGLLFASHNRYFINLVADQILHIENGRATLTHVT